MDTERGRAVNNSEIMNKAVKETRIKAALKVRNP